MSGRVTIRSTGLSVKEVQNAPLPKNYTLAKAALEACATADECKEWLNRSAAAASYAKQARDTSLFHLARLIRLRALRELGKRMFELNLIQSEALKIVNSLSTLQLSKKVALISEKDFECIENTNPVPPDSVVVALAHTPTRKVKPWNGDAQRRLCANTYSAQIRRLANVLRHKPYPLQSLVLALPVAERSALHAAMQELDANLDELKKVFDDLPTLGGDVEAYHDADYVVSRARKEYPDLPILEAINALHERELQERREVEV